MTFVAIRLLKTKGLEETLVRDGEERAQRYDESGKWASHISIPGEMGGLKTKIP